jgi:hypothetical protein
LEEMLQTAYNKLHAWQTRRMMRKIWGVDSLSNAGRGSAKRGRGMVETCRSDCWHRLNRLGSHESDIDRNYYIPTCASDTHLVLVTFDKLCVSHDGWGHHCEPHRESETALRKTGGIGWRRREAISMVRRARLVEEKLQMQLTLIAHQVNTGIFFHVTWT